MADNYFQLFVNGRLVAVDSVPFTPFNSSVVRFRAKRPLTYAIKLVDWGGGNVGLGTESGGGPHHPGDGGFIARLIPMAKSIAARARGIIAFKA
jgi:hypothetical protein